MIVAIDPGQTGAIATLDGDGWIYVDAMPKGVERQVKFFKAIGNERNFVFIEDVGSSRPGNSAKSITTFARHVGNIEAICHLCFGKPTFVQPKKWMNWLGVPPAMEKKDRKDFIHKKVNSLTAGRRSKPIAKYAADAVGILLYAEFLINSI